MLACGVPVAEIEPGEGVTLEDGTALRAATVICNADPKRMLGDARRRGRSTRPSATGSRPGRSAARWSSSTPALERLPTWTAAPGDDWPARATIDATGTMAEAQAAFEAASAASRRSRFGEIYIQTGYDPSPAPEGKHLLSVFGQYAPYEIADGDWDARRDGVAQQFIELISRFAPDLRDCLADHEVLGPPDIESRIGLTGGNIFQGEVTPGPDVGGALRGAHPGAGPLHVRRRHPPGGQRDRAQRPQRRERGARRPGRGRRRRARLDPMSR